MEIHLEQVREALEVSWDENTSYQRALREGKPSFGQCYPTSRIVQFFFPEVEIVEGQVWTGKSMEKHFWNVLMIDGVERLIDLTWQQFPVGSEVKSWRVRERESLGDGQETVDRVSLLFERVNRYMTLKAQHAEAITSKHGPNNLLKTNVDSATGSLYSGGFYPARPQL